MTDDIRIVIADVISDVKRTSSAASATKDRPWLPLMVVVAAVACWLTAGNTMLMVAGSSLLRSEVKNLLLCLLF
jgi:hypothetical protein